MRLIGIIFALIVSALCSCSDQADTPSLEVKRDTVLSFGVYGSNAIQLNNFMFGGGSRITISKRDYPFTFYQNEKYDINAYNNLWDWGCQMIVGTVTTSLYSIVVMGNTKAFDALLAYNFLQRLTTKPLTIIVDDVLVAMVNKAVYKPVICRIVKRA